MGNALKEQGKLEEAIEAYNKALAIKPDYADECLPTTTWAMLSKTDEVSSKVRDQYEVSPYPRWVNLGLRLKPAPISKVVEEIKLKLFDDVKIKEVEAPKYLNCWMWNRSTFHRNCGKV
jgi:tetratricopeptide (TPR) repeat protein